MITEQFVRNWMSQSFKLSDRTEEYTENNRQYVYNEIKLVYNDSLFEGLISEEQVAVEMEKWMSLLYPT